MAVLEGLLDKVGDETRQHLLRVALNTDDYTATAPLWDTIEVAFAGGSITGPGGTRERGRIAAD